MITKLSLSISAIRAVVLTFAVTGFLAVLAVAQGQSSAPETNPEYAQILTNAPPPGFATRLDYVKSFTSGKAILDAYHAGKISQEEAILAEMALGDRASMDFYGKLVDQNGQPVAGVKVRGSLEVSGDFFEHYTETDAQGRFNFLGLHGRNLFILPQKEGYNYDSSLPHERPNKYLPDQDNPMVLTMWKLKGAEPMVHIQIQSSVPHDGSITTFDLLTGKKDSSGGMTAQLIRDPLDIALKDLRNQFNWTVILSITNGGLLEYTNQPYPYEAPSKGYQKVITLNFPTNMVGWQSWTKRDYYFNDKNGQIYGRMTIEIRAGGQTPLSPFRPEIYVNPAGSRNLEFDPKKQIR